MSRSPFRTFPRTVVELERGLKELTTTPENGTVTPDSFADFPETSVLARLDDSPGAPAYLTLEEDQFLVNRAGVLTGDGLVDADIPSTIARDSEVVAAISAHEAAADPHPGYTTAAELSAGISTHEGALDPHPQYLTASEGNAAYQPINAALGLIYSGTGSPEGVVAAAIGSLYLNQLGSAGTTLYVKEADHGLNTGWAAK